MIIDSEKVHADGDGIVTTASVFHEMFRRRIFLIRLHIADRYSLQAVTFHYDDSAAQTIHVDDEAHSCNCEFCDIDFPQTLNDIYGDGHDPLLEYLDDLPTEFPTTEAQRGRGDYDITLYRDAQVIGVSEYSEAGAQTATAYRFTRMYAKTIGRAGWNIPCVRTKSSA